MANKPGQNSRRPTVEMLADLTGVVIRVLWNLSFEQVRYWLGRKTQLAKKLMQVFEIANDEYMTVREEWQKFYHEHFGVEADFTEVEIPPKPQSGSWRLIFLVQGITLNVTLAALRQKFKVWVNGEDLDGSVTVNTRKADKHYAVWVRTGEEPDAEYLGKSTREADSESKVGMTLLERLVLELKYFVETGKHLDAKGVTFCTGSRYSGGSVPSVCWDEPDGGVYVFTYSVDDSGSTCGLRQAVSL